MLVPGYGRLNDAVGEAMAMVARQEGLLLDPVYTGKAMAGLIAHVRSGRIAPGSRVLFVHTGGQPALFAYGDNLGHGSRKRRTDRRAEGTRCPGSGLAREAGGRRGGGSAASRRIHARNARSSGRCREAAVVIRQQRSGASFWWAKSGTRTRRSSSWAISIGRLMAAPSPFAAAWTSIE